MEPIVITERYEYDYCLSKGYEPLIDTRFSLDIRLRVAIQRELFGHCVFGRGDVPVANQRFYKWVWEQKPHRCEETMRPLPYYSATFVSHILARGAYPEMAHDPRNVNILCAGMHEMWEHGRRDRMRIYPGNVRLIQLLKNEYQSLKL